MKEEKMSRIEIQIVKQPTKSTCVHACLSMVTGIPVEELVNRFGVGPMHFHNELTVLTEMGICPVPLPASTEPLMTLGNVFFATTPSLNKIGINHGIVIETLTEGDVKVYDPSPLNYYPLDALQPTNTTSRVLRSYSEIKLLQSLPRHKGTKERYKLYKERKNEITG